jgi:hypothetical protein
MAKAKRSPQEHEQLLQTVQMFEVIAETQPNDIQSLEILKEAYLNLERDADAVGISKKVAQAYVHLGQLSSAILEYEGILQKFPDDADSLAALGELENKMAGIANRSVAPDDKKGSSPVGGKGSSKSDAFEDPNESLAKFFVEHQILSEKDKTTILSALAAQVSQTPSGRPAPSMLALLSERGIASVEKSLALMAEKTRIPYIPFDIYDVDHNRATMVDKDFSMKHLVLPIDQISKTVLAVTANPFDNEARAFVEKLGKVQWYLAQPADIARQLKDVYHIVS